VKGGDGEDDPKGWMGTFRQGSPEQVKGGQAARRTKLQWEKKSVGNASGLTEKGGYRSTARETHLKTSRGVGKVNRTKDGFGGSEVDLLQKDQFRYRKWTKFSCTDVFRLLEKGLSGKRIKVLNIEKSVLEGGEEELKIVRNSRYTINEGIEPKREVNRLEPEKERKLRVICEKERSGNRATGDSNCGG